MDGFLHAIAIGPTTLQPKQWLSKIWGIDSMMPPVESIEKLNHILVWSCATSTASSRALRGIRAKSVLAGQR